MEGVPDLGTIHLANEAALVPGGNAVNTAIAAARLGVKVRMSAAVGDDRIGSILRAAVRENGVDDANLVSIPKTQTALTVALVDAGGQRRSWHVLGANALFTDRHLDWNLVTGARVVHYGGTFLLPGFDGVPLIRVMARAKSLGCLTSLDVCWDPQGRWLSLLGPVLPHTDLLFSNLEEGRQLTGEHHPEAIGSRLLHLGVKTVVVKLGSAGCFVQSREETITSSGFVVPAVETTAAGDCFAAAFLAARLEGANLHQAARFANAAAALSTLRFGSEGAPTRQQVLEFLAQQDPARHAKMPE